MKSHGASATALVVAAASLLFARDTPENVASSETERYAMLFLRQSVAGRRLEWTTRHAPLRFLWRCLEHATHPGIIGHYVMRKRWFEQHLRVALAQGCEQLMVLGAGLDSLAARIAAEFPAVEVIELDHPATQKLKRQAFTQLEAAQRLPHLQAIDLTRECFPPSLLIGSQKRVVVAEGVLMYLPETVVARLFQDLASAQGSTTLLFSFMPRWPDGSVGFLPRSQLVARWLKMRSEQFQWALPRETLHDFLQAHGFTQIQSATPPELAGNTSLDGETLVACVAQG